ncbi:MAG: diguanylate cyclase [Planctomycetota bacterium]
MHRKFDELRLTGSLPSPSAAGLRILELTKDEEFEYEELVRTILADPALSGRIIKIANAARRDGLPPVSTVAQATMRLGARAVRTVALGFTLIADNRRGRARHFDYDEYWATALATAVTVHMLGQVTNFHDPASAFTCALLCDVGKLAFASIHPERYSDILEENPSIPDLALARLEARAFGIDHFEVSAAMLAHWGLPREFQEVALLRGQERDETRSEDDDGDEPTPAELLTLVRGGRQIARLLVGDWDLDDARWRGAFLSLTHLAEELSLEPEALLSLCDAIVPSWSDWGKVIGLQMHGVGSFQETAMELERRGLKSAVLTAPADLRVPRVPEDPEPGIFQGDLELPLHPFDRVGSEEAAPTRILLVEDDTQMLRLITHHLKREGYEVTTANTSSAGLAVAMETTPQIVITDWMMPEMSGLELCSTLRRSQAGMKMYIILVTARGEDDQIVEAFEAGADDYVVKPFNPRILLARVRAAQRMIQLRERVEESERSRLRQVAELGIMTRKLRSAALTDTLTQLPNRRYAMKRLKQEWEAAMRNSRPLSVIMCDIDSFKRVNDGFGHDTGDVVLREVALTLQAHARASDVLCRLGGEEFLVINTSTDVTTAATAAERLRAAIEGNVVEHGSFAEAVTVSLGVAGSTPAMTSVDDLIKAADEALYEAKQTGRNRVCVKDSQAPSDPGPDAGASHRRSA